MCQRSLLDGFFLSNFLVSVLAMLARLGFFNCSLFKHKWLVNFSAFTFLRQSEATESNLTTEDDYGRFSTAEPGIIRAVH